MTHEERLRRIDALADGIRARARRLDEEAAFPLQTFGELRDAGLLALTAPAEYGGEDLWWGASYLPYYELLEHLARIDSVTAQMLQVHSHALGILSRLADEEQLRRLLPDIVAHGRLLASVGSEARPSGKLADTSRTELEERPDGWHLTCAKHFASLAPAADELLVWTAVPGAGPYHDRGILVLVPREAPEVRLLDTWDTLGMRATVSWSVEIDDYVVPPERLIGEPGAWTHRDPRTFTLAFSANHLGAAQSALDFVARWVGERPDLAASEITQAAIGEMSAELLGVRAALAHAARLWEASAYDDAELDSIRTLFLAKRAALQVSSRAFDVCGARSAFRTHDLERILRDIRTFTLHIRDEQYLTQIGRATVQGGFRAKRYAGASTFPDAGSRA